MPKDSPQEFDAFVSQYGASAIAKLNSIGAQGQPEEQLRGPLELLAKQMASLLSISTERVTLIGEVALSDIRSRPDFAVVIDDVLIGFIEIKAPGKGANPKAFRLAHDKRQAKRLLLRPNIVFTDGLEFSLWQNGEIVGEVERLGGNLYESGKELRSNSGVLSLFGSFYSWSPQPPKSARELATVSAKLCRLLRDEVEDELVRGNQALRAAAADWRHLLFPEADDAHFADGYAQTITFGFLIARAKQIPLTYEIANIAERLGSTNSLIGRALVILADAANQLPGLDRAIQTIKRVLSVVEWGRFKGEPGDTWLYFYEHFLAEYDPALRKSTGSYYTPPAVVETMTRWTDEAISGLIGLERGLSDEAVTVIDPAMGTGTYLLEVLRRIGKRTEADYGPGAVGEGASLALSRLIGFEIQLGPYAVAQLRLLAELQKVGSSAQPNDLRTYVADTLSNPYVDDEPLGSWYEPISQSKRAANRIKREEDVLVVLGNPPYKERAKGEGSWVEAGSSATGEALLNDYFPPKEWGVGAHSKHLRNLYVYFWRWATWKAFEQHAEGQPGVVCFITVAGFLDGPGFQAMRKHLREEASDIWVVHCSPEGHQPPVQTRIFQSVQHEICIVVAVRRANQQKNIPADVRYRSLKSGTRQNKFDELAGLSLTDSDGWLEVDEGWRSPFSQNPSGLWADMPLLSDIFNYNGSGTMPGRTWVYAPDKESLLSRWRALKNAPDITAMRALMSEHKDRMVDRKLQDGLPGVEYRNSSVADDDDVMLKPVRIAYRTLERQWLIPDKRLINRPNPKLWAAHSQHQIYLTAVQDVRPTEGPAISISGDIPDIHHYNGRGGRVYPLWADSEGRVSNVSSAFLSKLSNSYHREVTASEVVAYIAGLLANPEYTELINEADLPAGIRVPVTADRELFDEVAEAGNTIIWLHTYGERGGPTVRPQASNGSPRSSGTRRPEVSLDAPLPTSSENFPNTIEYDVGSETLDIGGGEITGVRPDVRNYRVSGVNVIDRWFSSRRKDRTRPVIGERRISALSEVKPDHWLPEYTHELIDLLHIIEELVSMEEQQASLLNRVLGSPQIDWQGKSSEPRQGFSSSSSRQSNAQSFGQTELLGFNLHGEAVLPAIDD